MKHVFMEEANGDGGAGSAAAPATVAPAASPAGSPSGAASAAAAPASWYPQDNPDVAAYVAAKGWDSPSKVIESYRHAEKMIGRDPSTLLTMPRPDDTAGQRALFAKLGMPETADKYEFKLPEGAKLDETRAGWAKGAFHKAGLSQQQANILANEEAAFHQQQAADTAKQYEAYVAAEENDLKKEWAAGYEKQITRGKAAAAGLGFNGEMIDALESVLGFKETMKMFAGLGEKMGEDGFVTPETRKAGFDTVLTPHEAKVQWDQKLLDPNFKSALLDRTHPGHKGAVADQARLFKLMHPEE